jgi:hypothetical protein
MQTLRYFLWFVIVFSASTIALLATQGAFSVDESKAAFSFYQSIDTTFHNSEMDLSEQVMDWSYAIEATAKRYIGNTNQHLAEQTKQEIKKADQTLKYIDWLIETLKSKNFSKRRYTLDPPDLHNKAATKQLFVQLHHADTLLNTLSKNGYIGSHLSNLMIKPPFDHKKYSNAIYFLLDGANLQTTLAFLEQLRVEIRLKELATLQDFHKQMQPTHVLYDKFWVSVIPNRTSLQLGDTLDCLIYLAASSSMAPVKIQANGKILPVDANGVATYKTVCTKEGEFNVQGSITLSDDSAGNNKVLSFRQKYSVKNLCP